MKQLELFENQDDNYESILDKLAILSYDSTKQETYITITEGNDKISICTILFVYFMP